MLRITISTLCVLILSLTGCTQTKIKPYQPIQVDQVPIKTFTIPDKRYPRLAEFMQQAFQTTNIPQCTIDYQQLASHNTEADHKVSKAGYIRLQWPLPICQESKTNIFYTENIESTQLDGAAEWLETEFNKHPDGTVLKIMIGDQQIKKKIETKIEKREN